MPRPAGSPPIPSRSCGAGGAWPSPVEILLVRGNHDRHAGDPPNDLRINCVNAPAFVPPFVFRHEQADSHDGYGLAGHVHPGITLVGRGLQRETLPCFLVGSRGALIPAFGSFTGFGNVEPGPGERAFVVVEGEVLEVPVPVDLESGRLSDAVARDVADRSERR